MISHFVVFPSLNTGNEPKKEINEFYWKINVVSIKLIKYQDREKYF